MKPLVIALACAVAAPALAADWIREITGPEPALPDEIVADPNTLRLPLGFAHVLRFSRPFKTVIVGDPGILQVTAQTDTIISVIPVSRGHTNIIALDDN